MEKNGANSNTTRLTYSLGMYAVMWFFWSIWNKAVPLWENDWFVISVLRDAAALTLIWIGPWLLLLRKQEGWSVPLKKMFAWPPLLICVSQLCVSTAVLYTIRHMSGNGNVLVIFDIWMVFLSLKAGILEELAFRGFFFNWQAKTLGTLRAALINGILFALYHYPGLLDETAVGDLFGFRGALLFIMGILLSLSFGKWNSLPLNMVVHAVWNLLSYLFGLAG